MKRFCRVTEFTRYGYTSASHTRVESIPRGCCIHVIVSAYDHKISTSYPPKMLLLLMWYPSGRNHIKCKQMILNVLLDVYVFVVSYLFILCSCKWKGVPKDVY